MSQVGWADVKDLIPVKKRSSCKTFVETYNGLKSSTSRFT